MSEKPKKSKQTSNDTDWAALAAQVLTLAWGIDDGPRNFFLRKNETMVFIALPDVKVHVTPELIEQLQLQGEGHIRIVEQKERYWIIGIGDRPIHKTKTSKSQPHIPMDTQLDQQTKTKKQKQNKKANDQASSA